MVGVTSSEFDPETARAGEPNGHHRVIRVVWADNPHDPSPCRRVQHGALVTAVFTAILWSASWPWYAALAAGLVIAVLLSPFTPAPRRRGDR